MTSSSIILSNILLSESCELKTTIDSFMETKIKEFQEIMKSKVDSIITEKIDKFYNKSFEDHEKELFDRNGQDAINRYNRKIQKKINEHPACFMIEHSEPSGNGNGGTHKFQAYIFKNHIICMNLQPAVQYSNFDWDVYGANHNLSIDHLFVIKHFQLKGIRSDLPTKILEEHPEYFKKNCSDFEQICRKEYSEIEKTKSQLKALMDEQITKKDYYANLEKKIKDIEIEKKQLEEERIKLKEEKEKMVFIKEKLMQMKEEVELEKQKIEQQKNKTVDLDKCFEEIILSEKSKNKQSTKVAFD